MKNVQFFAKKTLFNYSLLIEFSSRKKRLGLGVESLHGHLLLDSFDSFDELAADDFQRQLHLAARANSDELVAFSGNSSLRTGFSFKKGFYLP